ncbi:MAG: peptidase C39 family protein [Pseudomonadota bacterium]|jgi:hypothetical protein|nr:hypothetical protein [Alphaproteobacteria bacterium]MCS5596452.1 peptidase C39 family protein [Alphaproteobacteria bacterium]MEC7703455.1 peptidase C39 family protein [Pseudomonadota bacterium]|tara:strand:+ start:1285 stop:1911 length:627 start_codon:yes stop_codon:yes gene_type:complete
MKKIVKDIYYQQTQDFTCGPACLIMALTHLGKIDMPDNHLFEMDIWRRANSVFMGKGHPGCGPYGLAIAAREYECNVKLLLSRENRFFRHWNVDPHKRETEHLIEEHDKSRADEMGCIFAPYPKSPETLSKQITKDNIVINLSEDKDDAAGHWVCSIKQEDGTFLVLDPYIEEEDQSIKTHNTKTLSAEEYYQDMQYMKQRVALILSY